MATLLEKANQILAQKEANLLPENLKSGITCMGVEGTLQEGIDTSDATATADDILQNKTAYVNGEKITGNIIETSGYVGVAESVSVQKDGVQLYLEKTNTSNIRINSNISIQIAANSSDVANAIGLTADKIKAGETILGITGTYTGQSTGEGTAIDLPEENL